MFARSWLRAALGAGGTILLVPLGLVLAVSFAAAVGGTSLDGLGQVFGGPQVPGLERDAGGTVEAVSADPGRDVPAIPARATGRPSAAPASVAAAPAPAPAERARPAERSARGDEAPVARKVPKPDSTAPAPVPPVAAPPAPAPAAAPAPAGIPVAAEPVRELGQAVQDAVAPILPPAADAVGTVVDLLAPPVR